MNVFAHHLYEYNRGLRRLILHTTKSEYMDQIINKLENRNIDFIIRKVTETKINVFFGDAYCIKVLKTFNDLDLKTLKPEQDFILGAMLGYDMEIHCKRYLSLVSGASGMKPGCELTVA